MKIQSRPKAAGAKRLKEQIEGRAQRASSSRREAAVP
jgi:hypothetical protein